MYATLETYTSLYGEITETEFNRFGLEADRVMDMYTTGIDNVKKLKIAFPAAEDSNIQACACAIINVLKQISDVETSQASARGYTEGINGLQGKVVSSQSAGNESVSYGTAERDLTAIDKAVGDTQQRNKLIMDIVKHWLSGITDANGVNLFYMGPYPVEVSSVS